MNRTLAAVAGAITLTWIGYALTVKHLEPLYDPKWPGTFGDSFGALNTLFTGLAFAGLIASLSLQRTELSLQREELKQQREVLEAQSRELSAQAEAMKRSAEAQERTARAQEQASVAQARSAAIALKAEQVNALAAIINSIAAAGHPPRSPKLNTLKEKHQRLVDEILQMADTSD